MLVLLYVAESYGVLDDDLESFFGVDVLFFFFMSYMGYFLRNKIYFDFFWGVFWIY